MARFAFVCSVCICVFTLVCVCARIRANVHVRALHGDKPLFASLQSERVKNQSLLPRKNSWDSASGKNGASLTSRKKTKKNT